MLLTEAQLRQFLSDHLHAEVTDVVPAGHGEWSQAFFFSAGEQRKVIRFSSYDEDFRKDLFAARFASPDLPIPPIDEMGETAGRYFAISSYVDGAMIDELSPEQMRASVPAFMKLLIALRRVDGSNTRGFGGFGPDGNAPLGSWREYLIAVPHDSPGSRLYGFREMLRLDHEAEEIYEKGRGALLDLAAFCPEERHLVHNDLLHFNLILNGGRIAAVIDWGCGLWGDFLYDLGMFAAWQFYYPAMTGIDFVEEARRTFRDDGVALPQFDERVQCYRIHQLLDTVAYNTWKGNGENLRLTIRRLREVLESH